MSQNKRVFFYLGFLFSLITACNYQHQSSNQDQKSADHSAVISTAAIDSIVHAVDTNGVFNGIVGILNHEHHPQIFIQGHKSPLDKKDTLDKSSYFHLASCSKLFTGFALMQLMEEHQLHPSDQIAPYFPELHPKLGKVTIQQLANHRSGIHDYLSLVETPHLITNTHVLNILSKLDSTVYEPGTKWGYTNSGYVLISLLIERISEKKYNDYLLEKVLHPLGIKEAQLQPDELNTLSGHYGTRQDSVDAKTTGGSGIYLRAQDFITFYNNQSKFNKEWRKAKALASPWTDSTWTYGFGWFFSEDKLGTFRAHAGRGGGFQSYLRIYDKQPLMLFILSNREDEIVKPTRMAILDHIESQF